MPIHIQFECVEAVCILENVAMVCSSSLLILITAMLTYRLWVFALRNCLRGWHVATSRVCMGVVFGAMCTCGYVLHHYTAYHYTAIASITSPSSDVTLPSSLIHHCLVWPFVPNWWLSLGLLSASTHLVQQFIFCPCVWLVFLSCDSFTTFSIYL